MHRLSVAADNANLTSSAGWAPNRHSLATRGRRSSVAPSRLSSTGGALSRLSLGLSDALQWLGIKGKIPTAAAAERLQPAAAANGSAAVAPARPALSPIASPGGEEQESTAAEESPLPAGAAAAADSVAQAADACEQATAAAAPAAAEEEGEQASEEAVEQQLAALVLQDATAVEVAATTAQVTAADELAEAAALPATPREKAEAADVEEDLTQLQQLLVLCGQEVRGP